jgi:UDP-N-acetyl-D-glucosamine dehydrogenase
MVNYITERIEKLLKRPLKDLNIQIAGISYKADIPDLRESPVLELIDVLRKKGAKVSWADPLVQHWNGEFSETLSGNIDLGLIVTPHEVLNFDIWKESNIQVLDLSSNDKNYGWPKFL